MTAGSFICIPYLMFSLLTEPARKNNEDRLGFYLKKKLKYFIKRNVIKIRNGVLLLNFPSCPARFQPRGILEFLVLATGFFIALPFWVVFPPPGKLEIFSLVYRINLPCCDSFFSPFVNESS